MRRDRVSFTRTGCIVAMSLVSPSMIFPPCCGLSDAAGDSFADGPPVGVQAVATSTTPAKPAMSVRKRFVMPLCGSFPMRELREFRHSPAYGLADLPPAIPAYGRGRSTDQPVAGAGAYSRAG